MTDEELAAYCNVTLEELARLPEKHRRAAEGMANFESELKLWQAGLGPKPTGAIMCFEHKPASKPNG